MNTKEVVDKINGLANEQQLTLLTDAQSYFKARTKPLFTSIVENKNGSKAVFRFAYSELLRSIDREISIYKKSEEAGFDFMPRLLSWDKKDEYAWLIYDFFEGDPSGNVYQFDGATDFTKIHDAVSQLQTLVTSLSDPGLFHGRSHNSWKNLLDMIVRKVPNLVAEKNIYAAINKLKELSVPKTDVFVHGDLHPKNIITNGERLCIIDWEEAHFDSLGFDLSFLYIRSYNKEYRNQLMERVFSYDSDRVDFYYVLLLNLLRDYFEWHLIIKGENELMDISEIIGSMAPQEILEDLREQISINYQKIIKMGN